MLSGFKKFILRGNVVDMAVGVIIGAAFGAIVKSMVEDIVTPLIGMAGGAPDFSDLRLVGTPIMIGKFINALINFFIQATVVYFVIVVPINKLLERVVKEEPKSLPEDVKLLTEIRDLLKVKRDDGPASAATSSFPA
jgi:large conductance mechanosensitive channel